MTVTTGRGTILGMDDDIPDFGDLDGLAWLVQRAIEVIERMDLPDDQREAWNAEIEEHFALATAGSPVRVGKPYN